MEKTRRVGVLTKRVIELLELELPEGKDILLGDSNIGHMTTRHPEDFALYGEYIPRIMWRKIKRITPLNMSEK